MRYFILKYKGTLWGDMSIEAAMLIKGANKLDDILKKIEEKCDNSPVVQVGTNQEIEIWPEDFSHIELTKSEFDVISMHIGEVCGHYEVFEDL